MRSEETNALEDAVNDIRQFVAVQIILHLQILLVGFLARKHRIHADLVRNNREVAEIG